MFTQQHYIAIARILSDQDVYEKGEGGIVEAFVREFEQDNTRFDAERFRDACNGDSGWTAKGYRESESDGVMVAPI